MIYPKVYGKGNALGIADEIHEKFNKSAFNDLIVVTPTPIVQVLGTNGLTEKLMQRTAGSGSITVTNGMFHLSLGTTIYSYAALLSQVVPYKSRFGGRCVLTGMFSAPAALTQQIAGFSTATDRLAFGYSGLEFGIWYDHHGANGIWRITITVGATGSGTASVTLNGTLYSIPVTAGTIQHTCYEIAKYLDANAPGYLVTATDDDITIMYEVAQPTTGDYTFSSTGGVVGSIAVVTAGARATSTHIPQSSWDNPCPWLDPQKLNVYTVQYQYVGGGKIEFLVESPNGDTVLAHIIQYANRNSQPSISDPNMRVGIVVASLGGTADISLKSACMSAFIDGVNVFTHEPHVLEGVIAAAGTTLTNMLTIRNAITKNGRDNRVKVRLGKANLATHGAKGAVARYVKNGTPSSDLIFYDYDAAHSVIQYSTSAVQVTGESVGTLKFGQGEGSARDDMDILLEPGDMVSIVGAVLATPTANVEIVQVVQEDM